MSTLIKEQSPEGKANDKIISRQTDIKRLKIQIQ